MDSNETSCAAEPRPLEEEDNRVLLEDDLVDDDEW